MIFPTSAKMKLYKMCWGLFRSEKLTLTNKKFAKLLNFFYKKILILKFDF